MLSAALVAFTIECGNEVERGFGDRGHNAMVSLVAWLNVLQYLGERPVSVAELCSRTYTKPAQVGHAVGCLERWGFVSVNLNAHASPRSTKGAGWGSARAITLQSTVALAEKGQIALELWPVAIETVESRWERRCGSALTAAVDSNAALAASARVVMPEGLPSGWMKGDWRQFPAGEPDEPRHAPLAVSLGRALLAVTIAYEQRSAIPLALAANTLRVVEESGTPVAELHVRSGISPETTGPQCTALTARRLAELVSDPTRRGKTLRLTAKGKEAQDAHATTMDAVEAQLGSDSQRASRAMRALLACTFDGDLAIRVALTPSAGVRRSGAPSPALGRKVTASAARARNRQLVAQTESFLANPFGALPHYPVWDGNRGFGP